MPVSLYPFTVFAALAILAGFLQIRLRGLGTRLSIRFFVVLISMAALSWPETVAIAFLSALVESAVCIKPRPAWMETLCYGAISTFASIAACAMYHISSPSPLLMVLAAMVYFAVTSVALARFSARVWKQSFFWTFPHYVAGGSATGVLTIANRHNGWEITLLVVPILYWMVHAYKLYLERRGTPQQADSGSSPVAAARQDVHLLFALAQDLGNSLSLDETFAVLSQHVKRLCPHDTIAVYIRREDRLEAEYSAGIDCQQIGSAVIRWGEGICGRVAATAAPLLNEDPLDYADVGGPTSLRSSLAIPLEGFSGVGGVLCLYAREKNAFTEDHLRVLSAAATKVAVSVENALKYRQAERSAVTDMLTELPNARSLFMHLDAELARARRTDQTIAVLVCDLDGFKQINDRFGHQEGNRVLRAVAQALRSQCREYDTVARLGGDEFVLVLPGQQSDSVGDNVERLTSAVAQAGFDTVGAAWLGVSVGVAYYPADGQDADALLAVADQRMYREKQRGEAGARGAGDSDVLFETL
jgi:diguanylate cyclase (GGDEF)-like protein